MPKPFPKEFGDDVVRVAQNRDTDVTLAQNAQDRWLKGPTLNAAEQPALVSSVALISQACFIVTTKRLSRRAHDAVPTVPLVR